MPSVYLPPHKEGHFRTINKLTNESVTKMAIIRNYRNLYRRLVKLPLDEASLGHLRLKIRSRFESNQDQNQDISRKHILNRKQYEHAIHVMDSILVKNKFLSFGSLLDLVYVFDEPQPQWVSDFHHTKYSAFKPVWPQIHLIDEFGSKNHIRLYYHELEKLEPILNFLIMKEMSLEDDPELPPLEPIKHNFSSDVSNQSSLLVLYNNINGFYKFLNQHSSKILKDIKIKKFEVFYKPNPYGYPLSVETREIILRKKINYMKKILRTHVPISLIGLLNIISFIKDESKVINPNYYRHMVRKRENDAINGTISYYEKKFVMDKQLIPDERLFRFYYRKYAVGQFSRNDNNTYIMSPMSSIYE